MTYRTAFYYDERNNLARVLDPDNGLTYYGYDDDHRLTSVQDPAGVHPREHEAVQAGVVVDQHLGLLIVKPAQPSDTTPPTIDW